MNVHKVAVWINQDRSACPPLLIGHTESCDTQYGHHYGRYYHQLQMGMETNCLSWLTDKASAVLQVCFTITDAT